MAHLAGKCTITATNKIIANIGTCKAIDKIIASDKIIAKTQLLIQRNTSLMAHY